MRALTLVCLLLVAGCGGKKIIENEAAIAPVGESGTVDGSLSGQDAPSTGEPAGEAGGPSLETAYFAFDSYTLRRGALDAVRNNIRWMNEHAGASVQIEGHCDERGTTEYNLALGERRSQAVRDYMIKQGISPDRISVLSYGEERPENADRSESGYSKNRRAETIITGQ